MTMRQFVLWLASACLFFSSTACYAAVVLGADTSWLSEMEANGYQFYNSSGTQQDLFPILKQHGMTAVRLRVWVNPQNGYNGMADVLTKAQRVKAAGMKLMIDFHYSDSWADPGKQTKPAAWANYSVQQLMDNVWAHTRTSLLLLRDAGITPDWVQVGNETNDGMLWPEGRASLNMQNYAWFTSTGYNAVKDVFPATPVVVHLANCHNVENFRWIFNGLKTNGGKFDMIAASAYPTNAPGYTWQNANAACLYTLNEMAATYGTGVMVTEVGAPWDHPEAKQIVADLISKVAAVNSGMGLAVFYWEPQAYASWQGYTLGAFSQSGGPGPAMQAFLEASSSRIKSRLSGKCIDVPALNQNPGTVLQQYSCGSTANQQWRIETTDSGYVRLKVTHSGLCMDLASQSTANNIKLVQNNCSSSNSQQWLKEDMGSGYYRLRSRYSNRCVDVTASSLNDQAVLIQYSCHNNSNQQWSNH